MSFYLWKPKFCIVRIHASNLLPSRSTKNLKKAPHWLSNFTTKTRSFEHMHAYIIPWLSQQADQQNFLQEIMADEIVNKKEIGKWLVTVWSGWKRNIAMTAELESEQTNGRTNTHLAKKQLRKYTSCWPYINRCCIFCCTKYELWSTVIARADVWYVSFTLNLMWQTDIYRLTI